MAEQEDQVQPQSEGQVEINQVKLAYLMQQIRDNQNLSLAIAGGAGAALLGACLWAIITMATGYQIGFMAIGVGFMVGYTVRFFGKGIDKSFGLSGAILSLLGCLAGNLLAACASLAQYENMGFFDVLSRLDPDIALEIMAATFSPMDLLFYGIAVYEGYKFSFRQMTEQDLASIRN